MKNKLSSSYFDPNYKEFCLSVGNVEHPGVLWQGSVLLLLMNDCVLFIKRSEDVPAYKGHVALIGGHRLNEENDPFQVCAREFVEETGLDHSHLEFLGVLPPVRTASLTLIIPTVARLHISVKAFKEMVVSNGEWSVILAVPLLNLADEESWRHGLRYGSQSMSSFLFRDLAPIDYEILGRASSQNDHLPSAQNFLLWGATARIIWSFLRVFYL